MYLEYFQLSEKPYAYLTPNPRFFYYAPQYLSVKRKADYVVSERSGHLYIHGPIGSGKTTLLYLISGLYSPLSGSMTTMPRVIDAKVFA